MDIKKIIHGLLGSAKEEKQRHAKWAVGQARSELSKREKAGHKGTTGKRQEY